jgi:hypothetical protein
MLARDREWVEGEGGEGGGGGGGEGGRGEERLGVNVATRCWGLKRGKWAQEDLCGFALRIQVRDLKGVVEQRGREAGERERRERRERGREREREEREERGPEREGGREGVGEWGGEGISNLARRDRDLGFRV